MALWKKMTQYKKILSSQKKKIIFGRETGFPTDVENMVVGGSLKFGGWDLCQHMGGGWGFKMVLKNTCEVVHLLVKLLAICQHT